LYAGIGLLATKGFRGGVTYNKETGARTFTFQGWESAVDAYNGNGVSGYKDSVLKMMTNSLEPTPENYAQN
jgi:hypothetical protein